MPSLKKKTEEKAESKKKDKKKSSKKDSNQQEYTQDIFPVKDIRGGIILTTDGRFIKIMELQASNYEQLTPQKRNSIIYNFDRIFKIAPSRIQFKTIAEHINVDRMIQNVKNKNAGEHSENVQAAINDFIEQLNGLNKNLGLIKKYYLIFQYEGTESGSTKESFGEIYGEMMNTAYSIENVLKAANTPVIHHQDENMAAAEFLYNYFNKKTSRTEDFTHRYLRIYSDRMTYFKELNKKDPGVDVRDFFAPKGIDFKTNKDFFMMDGVYYTYIAITDRGYPGTLPSTWLNIAFNYGVGVDLDFYIKRLPREITKFRLEKGASFKRTSALSKPGNIARYEDLMRQANNSMAILDAMKKGEDIYDCVTIATVWDTDPKMLMRRRKSIMTDLASKGFEVEGAHLDCVSFFKMTSPFMEFQNNIYLRDAHNFMTWSLGSIYNMTSFQLFDPTGFPIGYNMANGSVVCFNNFNTSMFKNGNMCITGTSGAGKSFTLMFIGRNLFLTGVGTFYILPEKGYEYEDACKSLDGQYIMLMPGSKDCINIMEIRPQIKYTAVDEEESDDADVRSDMSQSLLAKKVASLTVWIQLLLTEGDRKISSVELYKLNDVLTKLYGAFGITDDNGSIYDDNGQIKQMPLISDLFNVLNNDPELNRLAAVLLPFVSGSCRNMNQQTNVDLRSKCIVFNVDEASIGDDLLAAFMYIAFDCAYDLVKSDADNFDTIIMDEIWKMMKNEACAKQVQKLVKLIRGYGGSTIVATQEIKDFLDSTGGFGESVISNSAINFFMQINDEKELSRISELKNLSKRDTASIMTFERGHGMLVANGLKVNVEVKASDYEISLFTTDLNVKRQFAEKRKKLALLEKKKDA